MKFLFSPPDETAVGLLTLPWAEPLELWTDDRLVEIRQRGVSRHVVRFVLEGGCLYALKQISERLARREHRLLRLLGALHIPAVGVRGVVVDRGAQLDSDTDAVLVTTFLEYSTSYRALFSNPRAGPQHDKLVDALVQLLVRLHLAGFYWGDGSLSNTLFRLDAGALEAYLVDTETSEQHASLSDGQRSYDVELAREHVAGELMDLQAGELLPPDLDPRPRQKPAEDRRGGNSSRRRSGHHAESDELAQHRPPLPLVARRVCVAVGWLARFRDGRVGYQAPVSRRRCRHRRW